jgi:hypothetical protein
MELPQQHPGHRRVLEVLHQHVRLGWTGGVAHLDEPHIQALASARSVGPPRAVDHARLVNRAALASKPARALELVEQRHSIDQYRRTSTRKMWAGCWVGSSRTQFEAPCQVKRWSLSKSSMTYG